MSIIGRREGKCIDCGERIAIIDGHNTHRCLPPDRPQTEEDKQFATWFMHMARTTKRPNLHQGPVIEK